LKLVLATQNLDKIKEIRVALKGLGLKILTLPRSKSGKLKETGKTLEQNALQKAKAVFKKTGLPILADDTGLEVDYLNGVPGVKSSRYAGSQASYLDNNLKLLRKLEGVPLRERKARFRCVLALVLDDRHRYLVQACVSGLIARKRKGRTGFGYDPVFYLPKFKKTFAQMSLSQKNKISHRGRALQRLRKLLQKLTAKPKRP
jgi:XTP/dITP diphosphohydrolase